MQNTVFFYKDIINLYSIKKLISLIANDINVTAIWKILYLIKLMKIKEKTAV